MNIEENKPRYLFFVSGEKPFSKIAYFPKEDFLPGMLVYDLVNNAYSTDGYTFVSPKLNEEL